MRLIDFSEDELIKRGKTYHGNAGQKRAYIHDNTVYMVKFPQSTRDMQGRHLPSYTSSPISEYIGSHIYASLGIPAHETVLGRCRNKIVVACKDFTANGEELNDFHGIKNSVDEEIISGSLGSSVRGERLSDVLKIIESADDFEGMRDKVKERFWDMFVVDAFIRNNDRNNGNWGLLAGRFTTELAPVFDNGNAFFSKRNPSAMERRLNENINIENDIRTGVSFFMDDNDEHIHPFSYIAAMENEDCNAAVLRFSDRLDMDAVKRIIDDIPEEAYGLTIMPAVQKEFYMRLLEAAWEKELRPVVEKLQNRERNQLEQSVPLAEEAREMKAASEALRGGRNDDPNREQER